MAKCSNSVTAANAEKQLAVYAKQKAKYVETIGMVPKFKASDMLAASLPLKIILGGKSKQSSGTAAYGVIQACCDYNLIRKAGHLGMWAEKVLGHDRERLAKRTDNDNLADAKATEEKLKLRRIAHLKNMQRMVIEGKSLMVEDH